MCAGESYEIVYFICSFSKPYLAEVKDSGLSLDVYEREFKQRRNA